MQNQLLANRFREALLNGTWIANTNYRHQLEALDWKLANKKIDSLNTIGLLAQHIHYYINGVKNVFKGGALEIRDKFSFDFPPFQSQLEWEKFIETFFRDAEEFALLVEQLPENRLDEAFVDEKYGSWQRNIEAMIEHSYYHLGQIVLIKKMLTQNP